MSDKDEASVFELEELVNQPGTYFNPQSEVLLIVDDSHAMGQDAFDRPAFQDAEWVQISEETPVDELGVEEAMERFQTAALSGGSPTLDSTLDHDMTDDLDDDPEPELEPDEEH